MVFLSDRNITTLQKNRDTLTLLNNELKNDLEDLNILLDSKKEKENKAPFGIQSKGHDITYRPPLSPGPGAYNIDSERKQPFNSGINPFLFKSPRFKSSKSDGIDMPGPGSYNIANRPVIPKNYVQLRPSSGVSFQYNTNTLNNIATIPAKKQKFGYYIGDNGELIQAIDPAIDSYFSGTKSNSIGPDRYNPVLKQKNHLVSWNKMSGRKPKNEVNIQNNINNLKNEISINSSKLSLVETDISSPIRSSKERKKLDKKNMKPYQLIMNNRINKRIISSNNIGDDIPVDTEKELEFLNHENNIISGKHRSRNYFLNFNKIRYNAPLEDFQFFGSSNERKTSESLILSKFPNIGPGSYFKNTYKKLNIINSSKNKQNAWEKSLGRDDLPQLKRSSSNIGPGSYNLIKNFGKKSFNSYGSLSSEKRFDLSYLPENNLALNENDNNIGNPGPGSYNFNDPWIKDIKKMIKRPTLVNVEEEIRKKNNKKDKERKPDFNIYQNDKFINIIQNNIRNKANPYASENMPFLSGEKRFKLSKSSSSVDLGPGKYNIFNKGMINQKFKSLIVPFSSNSERKPAYFGKSDSGIAPGQYDLDSYFDWNKKSFNAMFI